MAEILGWSVKTFRNRRGELEAEGFPRPLPVLGRWDRIAIERWLDRRSGLEVRGPDPSAEDEWLSALGTGP